MYHRALILTDKGLWHSHELSAKSYFPKQWNCELLRIERSVWNDLVILRSKQWISLIHRMFQFLAKHNPNLEVGQ